jgi:hypothetical protein
MVDVFDLPLSVPHDKVARLGDYLDGEKAHEANRDCQDEDTQNVPGHWVSFAG